MKTLYEWQHSVNAESNPNYFFDVLIEASQKLNRELHQYNAPGLNEIADMAMCINRVLMELQHTGKVSERCIWQCNYMGWKCEQFHEGLIYGNFHKKFKEEVRWAIQSFVSLAKNMNKVPQEQLDEASRMVIHQGILKIQEMAEKLDELDFWNQEGRRQPIRTATPFQGL